MFNLPSLPYGYDALEPFIDAETMTIHHQKHHQTYIDKLNDALLDHSDLQNLTVEDLLTKLNTLPAEIQTAVRNHGGGHANHSHFWPLLTPDKTVPAGELKETIETKLGGIDKFKEDFKKTAMSVFGSGWAWLVKDSDGLSIISTANQDSPLMNDKRPIIGLDVWEHAYYLQYQNKRQDYIQAWWSVLNWDQAEKNFQAAVI